MIPIPPRWLAYGLGALVLAAVLAYAVHTVTGWRDAAQRLPVVEREYSAYQTAVERRTAEAARQAEADANARQALAQRVSGALDAIAAISRQPVKEVVYREKLVNGVACPDPRISDDWIGLYNDAAQAADTAIAEGPTD